MRIIIVSSLLLLAWPAHADGIGAVVIGFVVEAMQDPNDSGGNDE